MVVHIREQRGIVFDVATNIVVVFVTAACVPQIADRFFFLRAHTVNACKTLKAPIFSNSIPSFAMQFDTVYRFVIWIAHVHRRRMLWLLNLSPCSWHRYVWGSLPLNHVKWFFSLFNGMQFVCKLPSDKRPRPTHREQKRMKCTQQIDWIFVRHSVEHGNRFRVSLHVYWSWQR